MSQTESSSQKYLRRAFGLNPVWRAEDIIELRARALRLARLNQVESTAADQVDITRLRQAAKKQIANIQKEFWKLPLDHLKRQLEAMDVRRLPELSSVVKRLRTAAACRGEFPRLSQEPWMVKKLFTAFKSAAVLPPSEAGYEREKLLARIKSKKELQQIKNAVKKLETDYPVLYALERDWFTTLKKHKHVQHSISDGQVDNPSGDGLSIDLSVLAWPTWIFVFILIRVILRLLASS